MAEKITRITTTTKTKKEFAETPGLAPEQSQTRIDKIGDAATVEAAPSGEKDASEGAPPAGDKKRGPDSQ